MYSVDFDIKILTPLYMFGADQEELEIRTASFKGILRFWWRALKCCDDHVKLKAMEEKIFGGTSEEAGKSKVSISINANRMNILQDLRRDYNLKWNFNSSKRCLEGRDKGIGYLFYSMIQNNPKKGIYPKKYFKPDETFRVSLYSRKDEFALKNAVVAFWCAVNLGGFGSRSRRGAGSLDVYRVTGDTYGLDFMAKGCKNRAELIQWIIKNTKKAAQIIGPVDTKCRGYSNISSASFIISNKGYQTWYEALSDIGGIYADFRYEHKDDIQSGVFGFPIMHTNKKTVQAKLNGKDIKRRSSPLSFKVIRCGHRYYWMALRFAGDFLPRGAKLTWSNTCEEEPSYKLLDEFWGNLSNSNDGEHRFKLRGETV